ncbi:MAG: hypothetical protein KKC73_04180 [Proteobacteria bacterium]|nr:hypothetical protein [Pseudomonadota bacterium]
MKNEELNEDAMNHDTMHEAELENARTGIEKSVSKIRIVALLILLTGALASPQGRWRHECRTKCKKRAKKRSCL